MSKEKLNDATKRHASALAAGAEFRTRELGSVQPSASIVSKRRADADADAAAKQRAAEAAMAAEAKAASEARAAEARAMAENKAFAAEDEDLRKVRLCGSRSLDLWVCASLPHLCLAFWLSACFACELTKRIGILSYSQCCK